MTIDMLPGTPTMDFRSNKRGSRTDLKPTCVALGALAAVLLSSTGPAAAADLVFRARAVAAQEVQDPAVVSDALANGRFRFTRNLSTVIGKVRLVDPLGSEVIAAHLHCALAGQNGPIIVDLEPTTGVTEGVIFDGDLTNENVTDADCTETCDIDINNIASLQFAASEGCIYLNVHTAGFPDGEVRGQLLSE